MNCNCCPTLKRLLCVTACDEINEELCAVDCQLEGGMNKRRERNIYFMAWALILLILGGVAACSLTAQLPSNLEKLALSDSAIGRLLEVRP